ncbi:PREDICTED: mucin-2-like [Branchiostoma belcheri]|uniref:Mucin-2-like n=1 Tax=Branchiostoma belcheri TaxID=7741 RepID=A0A6P4XI87_BRABE|nr:PREDICTED: mucin-2-like [Branchiostoma belcheri]
MKVSIALLLVMCATWRMTEGYVYGGGLMFESTWYGPEGNERVVTTPYCEWAGQKMMIGSSWKTTRCEECDCSNYGLQCRGRGVSIVPDHCMILIDETCQEHIVSAEDPYSDCDFSGGSHHQVGQPATPSGQPTTPSGQSTTSSGQPAASSEQPTTSSEQPTTSPGQPTTSSGQPATSTGQPTTSPDLPTTTPGPSR